jgi:hypothetical protein
MLFFPSTADTAVAPRGNAGIVVWAEFLCNADFSPKFGQSGGRRAKKKLDFRREQNVLP